MTTISRSALLSHTATEIFALVNDIESYPKFMDGCVGATILRREGQLLEARLDLSKGGMSQSFTTRNTLVGVETIVLELVEGPFEFFEGRWGFQALGDSACKVSLHIEFAISSSVLGAAAGKLFERVSKKLVESVSQRAKIIYG
jgi:ribosome-associated toxin RatA of RatAB toxin-antitoxin module